MDGRVLSGKQALDLGFVDQLGDFDDAVKAAKRIAKIQDSANLIEYRERYDISNFLSLFGQSSQAHDIKLDMGLDIPKLQAGALYFLWQAPGELNEEASPSSRIRWCNTTSPGCATGGRSRRNSAGCSAKSRR